MTIKITQASKSKTVILPDDWQGLSLKMRRTLLNLYKQYEKTEAIVRFLPMLLGTNKGLFYNCKTEDLAVLTRQLEKNLSLEDCTTPILPFFKHREKRYSFKKKYYFPKKDFADGTAIEFALALDYYQSYCETKNIEELLKLTAVLARPLKGTVRLSFKDNQDAEIDIQAKRFSNLPGMTHLLAIKYFESIKKMIHDEGTRLELWSNAEGGDEDEKAPVNLFGWRSVFRSMAEYDPIRYDAVCGRPFWEIFQMLLERKATQDFIKNQTPKNEDNNAD